MEKEEKKYRPGSSKKYDPNDTHFNPMHPPEGYPADLLAAEWADPEVTTEELPDGGTKYTFKRQTGND